MAQLTEKQLKEREALCKKAAEIANSGKINMIDFETTRQCMFKPFEIMEFIGIFRVPLEPYVFCDDDGMLLLVYVKITDDSTIESFTSECMKIAKEYNCEESTKTWFDVSDISDFFKHKGQRFAHFRIKIIKP